MKFHLLGSPTSRMRLVGLQACWVLALSQALLSQHAQAQPVPATDAVAASVASNGSTAYVPSRPLSLSAARALLNERSRSLAQARTAVDAARAGVEQAGVRPNPTLSWNGQHVRPGRPGGTAALDQVVAFAQTWERGDKRALRLAQAEALQSAARADVEDTWRQALLAMQQAWFGLLLAEQRETLKASTAEIYARSVDAAQRRVQAGDLAGADLARLRVDAERALAERDAARVERRRAQIALSVQLAMETQAAQLQTDGQWPQAVAAAQDGWQTDPAPLVAQRADVRSARLAVEAARKAVDLAAAQRHRDVGWQVLAERDRASGVGTTVGLGITVPLLWGNDYSGDIHRAQADLTAALQRLDQAEALARADVQQAQSDLAAARTQRERYEGSLLNAASRAAQAAEFAYARGALGVMDLLDARRTLQAVQAEALAARQAEAGAWAALAAATGADRLP